MAFGCLLATVALTFCVANAHAVTYDFAVSPDPPNQGEVTTFQMTPASAKVNRVRWDLDGDGDVDDGTTATVTYTYADPGPVTVTMQVRETKTSSNETVTKAMTVNAKPAADFGFTPASPFAGDDVAFTPVVSDPEGDDVTLAWDFDDGAGSAEGAPTHAFAAPGTYDVVLTATDAHGAVTRVTHPVTVAEDPGPVPSFAYEPSTPLAGDTVAFTSTSTPSHGSITSTEWDFDADGLYDVVGSDAEWRFEAGVHTVTMRVTQANGKQAVAFEDVQVAERPPPPAPAGSGGGTAVTTPKPKRPTRMRPFPIVRIAGVVLPHGALVRILSVRTPRGASVLVRCRGRGCPTRAVARSSAARLLRFHRFERSLPAGVRLEVFVHKRSRIGKYTRFLIRGAKPPARVDRCLMPGSNRPVRCP
jgi:PKD repeat protein